MRRWASFVGVLGQPASWVGWPAFPLALTQVLGPTRCLTCPLESAPTPGPTRLPRLRPSVEVQGQPASAPDLPGSSLASVRALDPTR